MQHSLRYTKSIILILLTTLVVHDVSAQRKSGGSNKAATVNQASQEELQAQRATILAEIKKTQEKLKVLQKDKNASLQALTALQTKLQARQALIGNINRELGYINENISTATSDVNTLKASLKDLQMHYAELIRYSYKQRTSQDMIMFIFSSKSFFEALRRYKYVKQYRDYRKQQAEKIIMASQAIRDKLNTLEQQRKDKDQFLQEQQQQQQVLALETTEKNKAIESIKGMERELLNKVAQQKKIADNLQAAITAAIRREIAMARKKAIEEAKKAAAEKAARDKAEREAIIARKKAEDEERKRREELERQRKLNEMAAIKAARSKNVSSTKQSNPTGKQLSTRGNNTTSLPAESTPTVATRADDKPIPRYLGPIDSKPDAPKTVVTPPAFTSTSTGSESYASDIGEASRQLSSNFENNRGSLSSPANGYICERFGKNKHPIYNVMTENYGIDIRTSKGAQVKSVFSGEVSSVMFIAGAGTTVVINHGLYFTVYSKLDKAIVAKGQRVNTNQAIGTVMTDADGNNQLHFEIWKVGANGPVKINPEPWIRIN